MTFLYISLRLVKSFQNLAHCLNVRKRCLPALVAGIFDENDNLHLEEDEFISHIQVHCARNSPEESTLCQVILKYLANIAAQLQSMASHGYFSVDHGPFIGPCRFCEALFTGLAALFGLKGVTPMKSDLAEPVTYPECAFSAFSQYKIKLKINL